MLKSSTLNLYDSVSGNNAFQVKSYSDRVEQVASGPVRFSASSFQFTNGQGQVVSDVVARIFDDEATVASNKSDIEAKLEIEKTAREVADDGLYVLITAEASNRVAAISSVQADITSETSARVTAVTLEISSRSAAITTVQTALDAEVSERKVDTADVRSVLDAFSASQTSAITAETTARTDADAAIQSSLDAEVARAQAAEVAEQSARGSADLSLSNRIDTEVTNRQEAVNVQKRRIDSLLAGSGIDLNQLKELVDSYNALDASQSVQIATLISTCVSLQAQLDAVKSTLDTAINNL